jgi:hypothetical protein
VPADAGASRYTLRCAAASRRTAPSLRQCDLKIDPPTWSAPQSARLENRFADLVGYLKSMRFEDRSADLVGHLNQCALKIDPPT